MSFLEQIAKKREGSTNDRRYTMRTKKFNVALGKSISAEERGTGLPTEPQLVTSEGGGARK